MLTIAQSLNIKVINVSNFNYFTEFCDHRNVASLMHIEGAIIVMVVVMVAAIVEDWFWFNRMAKGMVNTKTTIWLSSIMGVFMVAMDRNSTINITRCLKLFIRASAWVRAQCFRFYPARIGFKILEITLTARKISIFFTIFCILHLIIKISNYSSYEKVDVISILTEFTYF